MLQVNRTDFVADLKLLQLGTTKTKITEQLMHVFFTGTHMLCFGGEVFVAIPLVTDFSCSVVIDNLLHVVEKMNSEQVELSCVDSQLRIKGGKSKAGLPIVQDIQVVMPIEQLLNTPHTECALPSDFLEGVRFNMFSVSSDYTQGILTCISAKNDKMYSSDDLRISEYILDTPLGGQINIPSFYLEPLLVNVPHGWFETPSWYVFLCNTGAIVGVKKYLGDFPDVEPFFVIEGEQEQLILPKALKSMLDDILALCEGLYVIDKKATITINQNELTCRGESAKGWFEKKVEMEEPFHHDLTVVVNPIFLSQVLDKCNTVLFCGDRLLFTSEKFRHILALPVGAS
jgi:hypothetical protein